jgi:dTDP-4-dehydrorhamnose reductase
MKKRIYIAGCGGMLGEAFYLQFKDDYILRCSDKQLNNQDTWLSYLDFRQTDMYMAKVSAFMPDYLFHLGAYTDLEFCKNNPDEAYKVNTLAVEDAVEIANRFRIPLLYISTAGMFDGKKDLYDDWDTPQPLDVYARSKYLGERIVVENARQYLVCRAGWMVGGGPAKDKKFVQKIMAQLKEGKKELSIVNDKGGTMTYTHDFAKNVRLIIKTNHFGVYNMVCKGVTSRLEITKEILRILRLEDKVKINTVTSDHFKDVYVSERPAYENLINKKLDLRGLNIMRDWREALREYIEVYYKDYLK